VWGGVIKENDGEGEFNMIFLIYCKNFCKCPVVPPSTTIKKLKKFLENLSFLLTCNIADYSDSLIIELHKELDSLS
jgi:hypothetical protein